jgi:hypothetical protein
MAITINLSSTNVDASASNFVYGIATLTFSGTYTITSGDTLDFTQVADKISSDAIIQGVRGKPEREWRVFLCGPAGNGAKQLEAESVCGERDGSGYGSVSGRSDRDVVQLSITARKLL